MPISHTLKAFYNATFCDAYDYDGVSIWGMQDQNIEVEHTRQRVIKVQASDIEIVQDGNGIDQLPSQTISLGATEFDIISWQYHGNKREEIILVLEGDSRGN